MVSTWSRYIVCRNSAMNQIENAIAATGIEFRESLTKALFDDQINMLNFTCEGPSKAMLSSLPNLEEIMITDSDNIYAFDTKPDMPIIRFQKTDAEFELWLLEGCGDHDMDSGSGDTFSDDDSVSYRLTSPKAKMDNLEKPWSLPNVTSGVQVLDKENGTNVISLKQSFRNAIVPHYG